MLQALLYGNDGMAYGSAMDYSQIIRIEAGKRNRKACIRGLRITVAEVLGYLASGMTQEEILRDFPYLTREDILASLAFAADREDEVAFTGAPYTRGDHRFVLSHADCRKF